MAANIQCDFDARMAELLLDVLDVLAIADSHAGVAMPDTQDARPSHPG